MQRLGSCRVLLSEQQFYCAIFNSNMAQQISNSCDSQRQEYPMLSGMLPPANPIISKNIDNLNERVNFRIDSSKQVIEFQEHRSRTLKSVDAVSPQVEEEKKRKESEGSVEVGLAGEYRKEKRIFSKYDTQSNNRRGNRQYLASLFIPIEPRSAVRLPQYKGMFKDDQLIFDSNFQSANLMSVFRSGESSYDLILQNDVNTSGFTQWFNFKVANRRNNFVAKFNLVNLYKSKSLYSSGMKPIVHSDRSDKNGKRNWRRKGFNIYYERNEIGYEDGGGKCYKTLSFQYDFTTENDITQFAHAIPYTYNDLQKLIASLKENKRVTVRQIGTTLLGKPINVLKIRNSESGESVERKAIIILARQHPGETPGSFIVQQIICQLLRHSTEVDFLIWRFDIYIIPMVNIDGVILGNYRSNLAGYDLNRCWLKADSVKHPEVYAIKNYIKKICKKQHTQLILDLHGHSRKMGSFFYGNNFGKNSMLFPFIASKANTNIVFEDSKFSTQKAAKASTARVVLGNLIKQTGNVYTYQVSFYGNYKQNKSSAFSFNEEHYKELGKALVLSMYRTYMEMYKEEKSLKQSVFLKNMKKQIQEHSFKDQKEDSQSGSDSQAQQAMNRQKEELQEYYKSFEAAQEGKQLIRNSEDDITIVIKTKNHSDHKSSAQRTNQQLKRKISQMIEKNPFQQNRGIIGQRLPSIYEKEKDKQKEKDDGFQNNQGSRLQISTQLGSQDLTTHKSKGGRLKVYGATYELRSRFKAKLSSSTIQEGNESIGLRKESSNIIQGNNNNNRSREYFNQRQKLLKSFNTIAFNQSRLPKQQGQVSQSKLYRRHKHRNNSLTLKEVSPIFNDQMISEVVKVNKLDYQRLKEQQNQVKVLMQQMQKGFRLPLI